MNIEQYWEEYTSSEKALFQKSCRYLLKNTFVVRDKNDENKKMYYFVSKKIEPFSVYLNYIGFDVMIDRENGVIMLRNCIDVGGIINRYSLRKAESVVLCCLWTLYVDKVFSGSLSKIISISIMDLKFELEKYGLKEPIDKSTMTSILTLFTKFNLIDVIGKIGEVDCSIRLYPSLQFALDLEEFKKFVVLTEKRMLEKKGEEIEDDEDTDGE